MPVGTFSLVLHSHLPYYRKAGMWPFGEENLYEAIAETYLPLLNALYELREEGIAPKLTIGITPVLAEQLADEHLKQGFEQYIADIVERLEKDVHRYSPEGELEAAKWTAGERRQAALAELHAAWTERQALKAAPVAAVPALPSPEADPDSPEIVETHAVPKKPAVPPMPEADPDGPAAALTEPATVLAGAGVVLVAGMDQALAEAEARTGADPDDPEPTLDDVPEEPVVAPEKPDPRRELSVWYLDWHKARLADFRDTYGRDVLGAFRRLQDEGAIEIITCAATHGFSPLLSRDSSLNAQFKVGVDTYKRHFGKAPRGVWLPECAYRPGLETDTEYRPPVDQFLHENGLEYFFTDAHAVVGGKTSGYRRHIGLYGNIEYVEMPERPLSGLDTFHGYWLPEHPVAVYARNERAGWQVWSADMGYPGDPWYREFHKKDGNSGMPYWRVTGPNCDLADKDFYNPQMALQRIGENSDHYVALIHDMLKGYQDANGEEGHVVVPFDTELFGHWWFEGIEWIKQVVRKMAKGSGIRRLTIAELHTQKPPHHAFQLPESTWGAGGHYHVWMNPQVEWMWPIIHRCERRMEELVKRFPEPGNAIEARALAQAARELLLLEGSDWPFLVTTGQAKVYATDRFNEHVERFDALADALLAGTADEALVAEYEAIDNLFPDVDYKVFANRQERVGATN